MPKHLEMTPRIAGLVEKATDGAVDPKAVNVYEMISLNTLPVKKSGGLFNGAVHTEKTLQEMAAYANTKLVPVHIMHDQPYELPIGKVIEAGTFTNDKGLLEVRTLSMIPKTETVAINKLEGGAVEEVSVGLSYKHILCSECGWDYMSPEATFSNIWGAICANEHAIGVDGVHVTLSGMERWFEQSLVSLGAANDAKILSRPRALMADAEYNALAATLKHPELRILFASATQPKIETKEPEMSDALIASLTDTKAKVIVLEGEKTTLTANLATSNSALVEANAKVAALTTEVATLKAAAVGGTAEKLATAELAAKTATDAVRAHADRLAVAAGEAKLAVTATLAELQASITTLEVKLAAALNAGGSRSLAAGNGTGTQTATTVAPSAFKTRD